MDINGSLHAGWGNLVRMRAECGIFSVFGYFWRIWRLDLRVQRLAKSQEKRFHWQHSKACERCTPSHQAMEKHAPHYGDKMDTASSRHRSSLSNATKKSFHWSQLWTFIHLAIHFHTDDHNAFEQPQTNAWRRMSMHDAIVVYYIVTCRPLRVRQIVFALVRHCMLHSN